MLSRFLQPYFVWRPSQFFRALRLKIKGMPTENASIQLPWGATLRFPSHDFIAHQLCMHGIIAIEACEVTCRLLDEGETGVDAGSNVGTVSSCMIHRVGKTGRVLAFEMMSETYRFLKDNFQVWSEICPRSEAIECALSDKRNHCQHWTEF